MSFLANKKRAETFYRYFSLIYDRVNPILYSKTMRRIVVKMANLKSNSLVLEVGCGTGYTTYEILKTVDKKNVFAVDISKEQIKIAASKFKNINIIRGDAEALPFKSSIFDATISAGSIEYWPNPMQGVKEMVRVTKKGGTVVILGPRLPDNPVLKYLATKLMNFFTTTDYVKLLKNAGLKDIKCVEIGPNSFLSKLAVIVAGRV